MIKPVWQARKLTDKGFAHQLLVLLFVVVFAIAGIGYLIGSHAAICSPSATTPCLSSAPTSTFNCTIRAVPASPGYGSVLAPRFTITNTGAQAATLKARALLGTTNSQGQAAAIQTQNFTTPTIAPGKSYTQSFGITYTVPYSSAAAVSGYFAVTQPLIAGQQASLSACQQSTFTLPVQYGISCTVTGVPATVKNGRTFTPTVAIKNTGTTPFMPTYSYRIFLNKGAQPLYYVLQRLPNALAPGQKVSVNLPSYTLNNTDLATAGSLNMLVGGETADKQQISQVSGVCGANFTIPQ